jgi:hypothetical protein
MLPLKIPTASVAPAEITPSDDMVPAAMKAGELRATEPTLAASIADCNLLRICAALE